jgi:RNA polymerase sigma factor (sigma-70 family)
MFRVTLPFVSESTLFSSLLERARGGDSDALNDLARRFYPAVQALVHHRLAKDMRRTRPWLAARFSTGDVVQSVFEGVLRDLGAFAGRSEEAFIGYLAVMVRNRILDAVRFHEAAQRDGRRMHPFSPEFDAEGGEADPAEAALLSERMSQVLTTISCFEPRVQHLLRARMDGLASFRELAEQLGYGSESAARRAYFDAHAILAVRLRGET